MRSIFDRAKEITPELALLKPGESKEPAQSISTQRGRRLLVVAGVVALGLGSLSTVSVIDAMADPLPGGTLDPLTIHKYVTHLVIPPVMKRSNNDDRSDQTDDYQIAVRQFKQQILPPPPSRRLRYGVKVLSPTPHPPSRRILSRNLIILPIR